MMLLLLALTLAAAPAPPHTPDPITGRWEGTSICIKATWNAACHDETVRYEFVRKGEGPDSLTLHASKLVGEAWEWMGDLDLHWVEASHRWVGEFRNSRGTIEWSYWVSGVELHGEVVTLPERRKGRDVVVHR